MVWLGDEKEGKSLPPAIDIIMSKEVLGCIPHIYGDMDDECGLVKFMLTGTVISQHLNRISNRLQLHSW